MRTAFLLLALLVTSGFVAPLLERVRVGDFGWTPRGFPGAGSPNPAPTTLPEAVYRDLVVPCSGFLFHLLLIALSLRRLRGQALWDRLRLEAGRD